MPKTSDLKIDGRFMGLFIGDNGCGKTVAAAGWPGPIMFYDFDGRMQPVKLFYPKRTDIEYITVGIDPDSRNPNVIGFMQFCQQFEDLQDRCKWGTVVVDSITALTATSVAFQLGIKTGRKGKVLAGGIQVPTWDEFNGETMVVQQILEVAKILPCHVIFTAHPVTKSDIVGGTVKKARSIAAYGTKTPSLVPIYFNEIYRFAVEPPDSPNTPAKRSVMTQPDGFEMAKTALPLPPRIEITGKSLYKRIQEYLAEYNLKLDGAVPPATQEDKENTPPAA